MFPFFQYVWTSDMISYVKLSAVFFLTYSLFCSEWVRMNERIRWESEEEEREMKISIIFLLLGTERKNSTLQKAEWFQSITHLRTRTISFVLSMYLFHIFIFCYCSFSFWYSHFSPFPFSFKTINCVKFRAWWALLANWKVFGVIPKKTIELVRILFWRVRWTRGRYGILVHCLHSRDIGRWLKEEVGGRH